MILITEMLTSCNCRWAPVSPSWSGGAVVSSRPRFEEYAVTSQVIVPVRSAVNF